MLRKKFIEVEFEFNENEVVYMLINMMWIVYFGWLGLYLYGCSMFGSVFWNRDDYCDDDVMEIELWFL